MRSSLPFCHPSQNRPVLRQPENATSVVAVTSANRSIPVFLGVLMLSGAAMGNPQQPNILWIITDDHRPDSIEAYNIHTFPDRSARRLPGRKLLAVRPLGWVGRQSNIRDLQFHPAAGL